jgi:hypothetical protein
VERAIRAHAHPDERLGSFCVAGLEVHREEAPPLGGAARVRDECGLPAARVPQPEPLRQVIEREQDRRHAQLLTLMPALDGRTEIGARRNQFDDATTPHQHECGRR